jgi:transcriptional regulator with XRE-family HTH domain
MISLQQMRAARGLLNWSQSELAKVSGLSITAINNIDREISSPRLQTLKNIQNIFENNGIEFTEGHGVRICDDVFKTETYEGSEAFLTYMKDVVATLTAHGGEALHTIENEKFYIQNHRSTFFHYYQNFEKHNLKERVLMREGTMERYGPSHTTQYRWCSEDISSQIGTSIYGSKYCIFLPNKIISIENTTISNAYRKQFESNWKKSKTMPKRKSLYEEDLEKYKKKIT